MALSLLLGIPCAVPATNAAPPEKEAFMRPVFRGEAFMSMSAIAVGSSQLAGIQSNYQQVIDTRLHPCSPSKLFHIPCFRQSIDTLALKISTSY